MTPEGKASLPQRVSSIDLLLLTRMIAIIDYGMGNIHSVQKALELEGGRTLVTNNPLEIERSDKIVLPGVGAFDDAMAELEKQKLVVGLRKALKAKKPFLGICLGMQILLGKSEEAQAHKGLGAIRGVVKKFKGDTGLKVPHMGWNQLKIQKNDCPLLSGVSDNVFLYFCHSYYPHNQDKQDTAALTDYGVDFTSVIWRENIYGVQFHPEKSQETGLKMLKNFVELC